MVSISSKQHMGSTDRMKTFHELCILQTVVCVKPRVKVLQTYYTMLLHPECAVELDKYGTSLLTN